jgi:protease-4
VWTGRQAAERGLVDALGTLQDAIALAAERAELSPREAQVRRAEGGGGGPGLLAGTLVRAARTLAGAPSTDPVARARAAGPEVRALEALSEMGPILALPLERVDVAR